MDIKPPTPKRPMATPPTPTPPPAPVQLPASQPVAEQPTGLTPKQRPTKKIWLWAVGILLALIVGTVVGGYLWYQSELRPVSDNESELVRVTIEEGMLPPAIAAHLEEQGVIRNDFAFRVYAHLSGTQNLLQAGSYRLSPADSTPEIIEHLTKGNVDTFNITFLPGATLAQNREVFLKAGYSEEEVDAALAKDYDSPIFESKPAQADLEGYIYGETYQMGSGASVEDVLQHTFDTFSQVIEENDLKAGFARQGLNLHQGIILASIIQREAAGGDEAQIAQVFYSRLAIDMPLGADATYQYIADKLGVERDINLDNPYNTRRYAGLPPGPIAAPGKDALTATANPAAGDYLYFVHGDDNKTYFSRTLQEHEENTRKYCIEKCQII